MKLVLTLVVMMMLSACGHFHRVVEQKPTPVAPEGVKVKIGSKEVKAGDSMIVYKTTCKTASTSRGNAPQKCSREIVGRAKVVEVLDEKNAIINPVDGIDIDSTMNVEKE